MPGGLSALDIGFPRFTGSETPAQKIGIIQNYLYMLLETLRYTLSNLDTSNWNSQALEDFKKSLGEKVVTNTVISNTVITQNLYSLYGDIAELTCDRLLTANKVTRYQNSDTSEINYIWTQDRSIRFMAGTVKLAEGAPLTQQHKDRNGNSLYWYDAEMLGMSTTPTAYPVTVYQYAEQCKLEISFVLDAETGYYIPKIALGAGDGVLPNSSKAFVYKGRTGLELDYYKSNTGELRQIKLSDEGIFITPWELESIDFYENGFSVRYSGQTFAYTWTLGPDGTITSLITEDLVTIPVNWHAGDM